MTQYAELGPLPREPRRILAAEDPRLDPVAAVDALERKIGIPLQVACVGDGIPMPGDGLDEPPD